MPERVALVTAPEIRIDGTEINAAQYDAIVDLRVSQSVSMPSQLTLRLSDPDFMLIDGATFTVGKAIKVAFSAGSGLVTVFDGEIVGIGADQNAERPDSSELVVTGYDRSHRLGHTTRIRTFQKQKYSNVVATIAQEEGFRADVQDSQITFDYLIQTTTNYAFLNELAFRSGYQWSVTGQTLSFKERPSTASASVAYGQDLRRLKVRYSASSEASAVTVRSWDPQSKRVIVGRTTQSQVNSNPANAGTAPLGTNGRRGGAPFNGMLGATSLVAVSSAEATELASALGTRIGTADLSARCECIGNPAITAGSMVAIENAGTRLSGEYYVTTVEHHFGRNIDLTTTFTTGGTEPSSIVDVLGPRGDRVERFGQSGLTIGIVTNNKDPDGLGRVRVKFPALSDEEESWWARVVTPGAGSNAGLMFMPQIDDEVLVGFEHGDLRRPFVLGGVWGQKARPPTAPDTFLAQNKVIQWGLRTAAGASFAVRGGDAPADKHFNMELADGTKMYLGSDKVEVIAQNKTIELKSGQGSVLITDQGDVKLKGVNVTIEATTGLKLNGLTIEAKARTSLTAEGSASLALKGGATAALQSSGVTEVKGSLVKIN